MSFKSGYTSLAKLLATFLTLAVLENTHLFSQAHEFDKRSKNKIIKELKNFKKRNRLTSLSFSLFQGHDSGFDYAVGYANAARKIKATPDHIYTIASVTKSITGMTMMDLIHQDYLSLGDSVHKIIESFPKNVTVLDLLNHTSGFLREKESEHFLTNSSYKNVVDYLPVKFKLKIHRYANFNYAAVGAVIEKATRKEFSRVANDYFSSITGDSLYFSNRKRHTANPLFVKNYVKRGRRQLRHEPVDFGLWEPAAFAQTSSKSLAKFLRHHMTPQVINYLESHTVTIKTRKWRNGKTVKDCYSLGFRLRYVNDELKYIFHNGFLYGVLSTLYYFPKKDMGFVALSNMSSYPHQRLTLSRLYKKVERVVDEEFNTQIARYVAKNGYIAGVIYFETNKGKGELNEKTINDFAYDYLKKEQHREAISLFKLNNYAFPNSGSTYRSLAEAYIKNGDDELAEETLAMGLKIEPDSEKSINMLKRLQGDSGF